MFIGSQTTGDALAPERASRLKIEYADLPDGAKITYASDDAALVGAIHDWFNAQVSNHGVHASAKKGRATGGPGVVVAFEPSAPSAPAFG